MRLTDLLGRDVLDAAGRSIGQVHDVRLVQDGPYVEGFGNALRVEGVIAGPGSFVARLGFDRAGVTGPWPLTVIFRRLERRAHFVEWDDVASVGDCVRLRTTIPR